MQIKQAMNHQQQLGMSNMLKGRVAKTLLALQLPYCQDNHNDKKAPPLIRWKAWRKKIIHAIVTFTLAIWNDRNAIHHGTFLDKTRTELIAHVHNAVRMEYSKHTQDTEPLMDIHFQMPLEDTLKRPLASMKTWLKRIEGSRKRQSLLQAAKAKISDIQRAQQYVNAPDILRLNNRNLKKWIYQEFKPAEDNQTTLDQFFR